MSDTIDDKKELATNRLLEVLRGEVETVEDVEAPGEEKLEKLGLTDEERDALSSAEIAEKEDSADKKRSVFDAVKPYLSEVLPYVEKLKSRLLPALMPKDAEVGISIDNNVMKYVILTRQKKNYVLHDADLVAIDHETEIDPLKRSQFVKETIDRALPAEFKKRCSYSTIIRGNNVSIKKISLPKMAKKEMHEAVLWNARKELSFEAEETLIDYDVLGEVNEQGIDKTEVLAGIVDQKLLDEHLAFYKSIEIEPEKVLTVPLAIYANYLEYIKGSEEQSATVIDFGAKVTNLIFIHNGRLQFAREIGVGGDDITESLMGTVSTIDGMLRIDRNEAEKLKFEYGIPEDGASGVTDTGVSLNQILMLLRPSLERLVTQIQRSFDYYRSKFPYGEPAKIFITGGTAQMKNITDYLGESLGKDIERVNPFRNLLIDPSLLENKTPKNYSSSMSTLMGSIFAKQQGINMLPADIKKKPVLKRFLGYVTRAAALVLLMISYLSVMAIFEGSSVEDSFNHLNSLYQQTSNNAPVADFQGRYEALKTENDQFLANIGQFTSDLVLVDYLKLLSEMTPNYITLNSIWISTARETVLVITGSISVSMSDNVIYLAKYTNLLKASGMFSDVPAYQEDYEREEILSSTGEDIESDDVLTFRLECII